MTNQQIKLAKQLHSNGATWSIIANHFQVNTKTLRKHIQAYEQTNH